MGGNINAFRQALSLTKREAVFGTQVADADLTTWVEMDEFAPAKIEKEFRTNAGRINGARGKTLRQVKSRAGMISRKMDATVEMVTSLLALGSGGNFASSGSADPWTHTGKDPTNCTNYPYSTSLVEGIVCAGLTSGYKLYKGVCVDQFTLEGSGRDEVKLTYNLKHDGSETTKSSFSFPSSLTALTGLLNSHLAFKLYPNGGGVTDITDRVLSWKITKNYGVVPTKTANAGIYVPRYKYGKGNPNIAVEFVVTGDKSDAIYGYADAETLLTLQLSLTVSASRSVSVLMDSIYITADEDADDLETTLSCKVDPLDIIADSGPDVWTCKTGSALYLVASP
jgi:hypothetical protein